MSVIVSLMLKIEKPAFVDRITGAAARQTRADHMARLVAGNPFVIMALFAAICAVVGGILLMWRAALDAGTATGSSAITAHPAIVPIATGVTSFHHDGPAIGTLQIVNGGRVAIEELPLSIGRHSSNNVRLDDVRVSRHHARIDRNAEGDLEIENLTATRSEPNPMLVNGEYRETTSLHDGDVVSLGGVEFVFHGAKA